MAKSGRPSAYSKKTADTICRRIASGESVRSICDDKSMPVMSTIMLWVVQDRERFSEQYTRAMEARALICADKMPDISDRVIGKEIDPQAARAAMEGYKWAAERMAPKRYRPEKQIDHTSHDGSMSPVSELTDEQLARIAANKE